MKPFYYIMRNSFLNVPHPRLTLPKTRLLFANRNTRPSPPTLVYSPPLHPLHRSSNSQPPPLADPLKLSASTVTNAGMMPSVASNCFHNFGTLDPPPITPSLHHQLMHLGLSTLVLPIMSPPSSLPLHFISLMRVPMKYTLVMVQVYHNTYWFHFYFSFVYLI